MLLYVSIGCAALTLLAFSTSPVSGIVLLFVSKPLIDTTFAQPLIYGLHLTELVGALVPVAVFAHILFAGPEQTLARMPCKVIWTIYAADVLLFSLLIGYHQDLKSGANVFFRSINGFIGFYMLQAFFHDDRRLKILLGALIFAGVFPMGIGVYQLVTGTVWVQAQAEGLTRYVGLYHDAFTVRAYAFQTILAVLLYCALYARTNPLLKAGAFAFGALSAVVMLKAYSKAGILSFAIWSACWTVLRRNYVAALVLAAGGALVAGYYASEIAANIARLFHKEIGFLAGTVESSRTFAGRWYGWQDMMSEWAGFHWLDKVFGSGIVATGAHNDYLQMLFHGGLVGLGIYVSLLAAVGGRILANLRRRRDPMTVAALMLFLMWLVDTIGLVPSAYPGYQWFVWGMIGLSLRLRELEDGRAWEAARPAERAPAAFDALLDEARSAGPALAPERRYPIIAGVEKESLR